LSSRLYRLSDILFRSNSGGYVFCYSEQFDVEKQLKAMYGMKIVSWSLVILLAAALVAGTVSCGGGKIFSANNVILLESPWPMFQHDPQHTGRSPYSGPSTPKVKWSYTTGGAIDSCPAIGADGTTYAGSSDGKLYAMNPDGSLKWSYTNGGEIHSSPAIRADGTIYIGNYDGKLYAINPDGSLKWATGLEVISTHLESDPMEPYIWLLTISICTP
jgi:outer membrane protein assembly factor BamB